MKNEKGLPAALQRIFAEIADNENKEHQEEERIDAESQKKKELYDRISGIARKYGVVTPNLVDTVTIRSNLVTPEVKIQTPQDTVEIQITEQLTGGPRYSMQSSSFSIQNGERTLFHVREDGSAINWIGQEAAEEERDFVLSEILDPLEKKLKNLLVDEQRHQDT